jgi:hypothetical protein
VNPAFPPNGKHLVTTLHLLQPSRYSESSLSPRRNKNDGPPAASSIRRLSPDGDTGEGSFAPPSAGDAGGPPHPDIQQTASSGQECVFIRNSRS